MTERSMFMVDEFFGYQACVLENWPFEQFLRVGKTAGTLLCRKISHCRRQQNDCADVGSSNTA
jgi:hypothetical protein